MRTRVCLLSLTVLLSAAAGCTSEAVTDVEPLNLVSCFETASGLKCVPTAGVHYAALDADGDGINDPFVCADADSQNDTSSALRGSDEDGDTDDEDTDGDTDDGDTDDGDTDGDDDSDSDSDSDCDSESDSDSEGDSDSDSDEVGDADRDGVDNEDDCDSMVCEPGDGGDGGDGDGGGDPPPPPQPETPELR